MKKSFGARTLIFPTPVWCVGTYDENGRPNVMTIAWGGICCSQPPCVTISLRKATYTYGNIKNKMAYTLSVPSEAHAKAADYFGMVSGRSVDKFQKTGLSAIKATHVDAPYVGEFPVVLECKVIHTLEIGLHTQFIGEVMDVKMEEDLLGEAGRPEIQNIRPLIFSPGTGVYTSVGKTIGKAYEIGKEWV